MGGKSGMRAARHDDDAWSSKRSCVAGAEVRIGFTNKEQITGNCSKDRRGVEYGGGEPGEEGKGCALNEAVEKSALTYVAQVSVQTQQNRQLNMAGVSGREGKEATKWRDQDMDWFRRNPKRGLITAMVCVGAGGEEGGLQ